MGNKIRILNFINKKNNMATENNKNLKYTTRNSVKPVRKKLTNTSSIDLIKNITNQFLNAVKVKHS
jgi:hypothetical protein